MVQAVTHHPRRSWSRLLAGGVALGVVAGIAAAADDTEVIPTGFPISRYEKTLSHSPFALPTSSAPSVAPAQKQPGWSTTCMSGG